MEQKIYRYIVDYILEHKYAPSFQEIANEIPCGKTTVFKYVKLLAEQGFIEFDGKARAISVPQIEVRWVNNA